MREVARRRVRETVEDAVYVEQKIKHFNREGSEFWKVVKVPEFVKREVESDLVEYVCEACNETRHVRDNEQTCSPDTKPS